MRIWVLVVMVLALAQGLNAQARLSIPFADDAILPDGDSTDWEGYPVYAWKSPRRITEEGNALRYRLAYDDDFLYLWVNVVDGKLNQHEKGDGNPRLYFNDAIEFYVDPQHDSYRMMDEDDLQFILDLAGQHVVFRGGSKYEMLVKDATVPKDTATGLMIFTMDAALNGTLNHNEDRDQGYVVECAFPWNSLGVHPKEGLALRFDIGVDDMDTLVDLAHADTLWSFYHYQLAGRDDFGYPSDWQEAVLTGHPSWYHQFRSKFSAYWWGFVLMGGFLILPWLVVLWRQNRRLRSLPTRGELVEQGTLKEIVPDQSPAPDQAPPHPMLEQSRAWVLAHLEDDIKVEDLASHLATSLRNLQRVFKEELDLSPLNFILLVKMEQASAMLAQGTSVKEAAYATGFTDPSYFSKVFKRYQGCSPKDYQARTNR